MSTDQKRYPELEMGDSGSSFVWTGPMGQPMMQIFEDTPLLLTSVNGQLKVSTIIRSPDGKLVAQIIDNEWKINPRNIFDRNYSDDALEVKDHRGDIVLQIRVLPDRVQLQGNFYDGQGHGFGIGKIKDPNTGEVHGIWVKSGPENPTLELTIEPMFRYPSEFHLGERVQY